MTADDLQLKSLRLAVYAVLIVSSLSAVTAHICSARSRDGHTPFFSANDRSRWLMISALVDEGTYAIDKVMQRPGWKSIDMVRHTGRDGQLHYYSSKPTLLPTLLAAEYAALKRLTGTNLAEHPFYVARVMLIVSNVLPLLLLLVLLVRWVEEHGQTDWGRIFVVACAAWGTFLTTFAVTLNNHLPAAVCVMIAVACLFRVSRDARPATMYFALAGFAAAFAAANELPAMSFLVLVAGWMAWISPRQTLLAFLPAALLVAGGFYLTNFLAHESLRPPYAHRTPGDDWYDYPGSYWYGGRRGVDLGEPSRLRYGLHVLVGHHGVFSLTPIWLLSMLGIVKGWRTSHDRQRWLSRMTLLLTVVCLVFYILLRPPGDRNYGGVTSGFRWVFWLIPLWLLTLMPMADSLAPSRRGRWIGLALLAVSVFSASYAAGNPWSHPWIYQYWQSLGWVPQ